MMLMLRFERHALAAIIESHVRRHFCQRRRLFRDYH